MTPEERRQRADWPTLSLAVKMAAGGICQCGRRFPYPFLGMVCHHKVYASLGNEPLHHLQAMCDPCHANLHWRKKYGDLANVKAVEMRGIVETKRMRLADCNPFYWSEIRAIEALLDEAEYRICLIEAATQIEREWNDGRRAA